MFILDRKKDMIVSGGFNIHPREVEDVLAAHPGVLMAAAMGAPDDKWGEAVTAFVVARGDAPPPAQELIDLVKQRKGSAHAPKHIEFVAQLPLTGVGKLDKKKLRAALCAGCDSGRNAAAASDVQFGAAASERLRRRPSTAISAIAPKAGTAAAA